MFVGPVEIANITTTVPATPVPSSSLIPPPPLYYAPFPTGAEVPAYQKNESWKFPKDFFWGVASAAYQIEGAAKDEGRGPSVWDVFTHRVTDFVKLNMTGDVVDNGYYMYKLDIARMAAMGVNAYSFSISWTRIMPFGRGIINEEGLAHYDDVINTCLEYGITPIISLFHVRTSSIQWSQLASADRPFQWDTPIYLQNLYGGWLSEQIVDDFVEYARVVFERYGDRVPHWVTINEPYSYCNEYPYPEGYFSAQTIPDVQQTFYCGFTSMLAHSKAYHLGKSMGLNSTISVKNFGGYKIPRTNSSDDALAAQRAYDFTEGWFFHPLFIDGDWPQYLKDYVSTFLRPFTTEEKAAIVNSSDLFMYDAYTSTYIYAPDDGVAACVNDSSNPLWPQCFNLSYTAAPEDGGWLVGYAADPNSAWLHKATDWVPSLLRYAYDTWKPKSIVVAEFGFSEPFEGLKPTKADILYDLARMSYIHDYMRGILMALSDNVPVIGCLAWSFLDNFEWQQGFSQTRFGMQYVNFTSPTYDRTYKASFFEYARTFQLYQEK